MDTSVDMMVRRLREHVSAMADGPDKSTLQRQLRQLDADCPTAARLLAVLASERGLQADVLEDGQRLFEPLLQSLLDLLQDATSTPQGGVADFATTALLCSMATELAVAFHLAQRGYANQAYSHIRSILELADKIELFQQNSEEAAAWVEAGDTKDWIRFSAAAVRERLGKPRYDPLYSMFSELGPHGTFEGVQLVTGKRLSGAPGEARPRIHIWIGGCAREDQIVLTHTWLLYGVVVAMSKLCAVYQGRLPVDDLEQAILRAMAALVDFAKTHLLPWAVANEQDVTELRTWLEEHGGHAAS
jgi:hypothetical protein